MILYFNGDSFTYGDELWEELNIPGYSSFTPDEARNIPNHKLELVSIRNDLTYTGWFKNHYPSDQIINDGFPGSSQMSIVYRSINALSKLRSKHPTTKIVCVIQDTHPFRILIKDPKHEGFFDAIIHMLDKDSRLESKEGLLLKRIFLDYFSHQRLLLEHFLLNSSIQNHCKKLDINFFHWRVAPITIPSKEKGSLDLDYLMSDYFCEDNIYPNDLSDELREIAKVNNEIITLPRWHWKTKYHPIVAEKLNNFLISKKAFS